MNDIVKYGKFDPSSSLVSVHCRQYDLIKNKNKKKSAMTLSHCLTPSAQG